MIRHTVFKHSPNGPVVPRITHSNSPLTERVDSLVLVLTNADLTSESMTHSIIADYLQNAHFISLVKKAPQTIFGRPSDSFRVCYVQFIDKISCPKEQYKAGTTAVALLIEQQEKAFTFSFSNHFPADFFAEYFYGLTLKNWKSQQKSIKENAQEQHSLFHPITDLIVISTHFNPACPTHQFLQATVAPHIHGRELTFTRADVATPDYMTSVCQKLAQEYENVSIEVIRGEELEKKGLNLIYSVGKGSINQPNMVSLYYKGNPENKEDVYGLVGKGVTFDTGGLSLKRAGMELMYNDKGGACAVFAIFKAAVILKLKMNLVCTMGFVENVISDRCYRNSDILTSYKGLTVEILNTDAEGRLVLADCLSYQQDIYRPHTIFDFATLTGACVVALGSSAAGLFSSNDELAEELENGSKTTHQRLWRLPLDEYPRENTKNPTADIQNMGKAPYAGAGTAAAFLENFVEPEVKWAHIDIAGKPSSCNDIHGIRAILEYYRKKTQSNL